jgi:hypothetical protein
MRTFLFIALAMSMASCANHLYQPAATQPDNTETAFHHGFGVPRAKLPDANVTAQLMRPGGKRFYDLNLFVRNTGDNTVDFLPEQVNVYGYNKAGEVRKLRVFTAQEFVRRKRRNAAIATGVTVAVVATAAIAAANADSHHHNDDPPRVNNNWGNDWWWIAAATPTVIVNNASNTVAGEGNFSPPFVAPDRLMRRQTLYADEAVQGIIKVMREPGFDEKILVEVPVDGQFAKFVFDSVVKRY